MLLCTKVLSNVTVEAEQCELPRQAETPSAVRGGVGGGVRRVRSHCERSKAIP